MPTKIVECLFSPLIEAPYVRSHVKDISNTCMILYRNDKTGKHFFYMEADPGLFYNYQWLKCSLADLKLDKEDKVLHFFTESGSHYAFKIGWNYEELESYIDSL